ncbi:uncharacterized protein CPUR_02133 [Claviceps purpurea 20.1]|uniref:Uncharacterized protein n=1 Tax=Claviceps purpurea (strain 20.1) TaxID=1111077 RepID=M1W7A3_CLAP2|nr:uncharacterized protein CPUR_02133 [Claviceps purpurea 20.1]
MDQKRAKERATIHQYELESFDQ